MDASEAPIPTGMDRIETLGPTVLDQISRAVSEVVEATAQAIVSVRISRPGPVPSPSSVSAPGIGSAGSGVVIEPGGLILTNAHVVSLASSVRVTFSDGLTLPAEVAGSDADTDLALLRVRQKGLPHLHWALPETMRPGIFVLTLGRPGGGQIAVTTGIVSAIGRTLRVASGELLQNVIQTTASLIPGTSGGALVDARGRLVGLNVAAPLPAASAVAFAIPADTAQWVTERLLADGRIVRRNLGFAGQATPVNPCLAGRIGLAITRGVSVEYLDTDGPAERAGLARKDVIVEIAGRPVHDLGMIQRIVAEPDLSDALSVVAIRADRRIDLMLEPQDASPVAAGS